MKDKLYEALESYMDRGGQASCYSSMSTIRVYMTIITISELARVEL